MHGAVRPERDHQVVVPAVARRPGGGDDSAVDREDAGSVAARGLGDLRGPTLFPRLHVECHDKTPRCVQVDRPIHDGRNRWGVSARGPVIPHERAVWAKLVHPPSLRSKVEIHPVINEGRRTDDVDIGVLPHPRGAATQIPGYRIWGKARAIDVAFLLRPKILARLTAVSSFARALLLFRGHQESQRKRCPCLHPLALGKQEMRLQA
mmetsp:Transcript_93917/g.265766  ORF Transcript_93917/g.265766 Transcript_93917/m.265766 type:complete len:207 (+) Transcript_93917:1143-1763(+)